MLGWRGSGFKSPNAKPTQHTLFHLTTYRRQTGARVIQSRYSPWLAWLSSTPLPWQPLPLLRIPRPNLEQNRGLSAATRSSRWPTMASAEGARCIACNKALYRPDDCRRDAWWLAHTSGLLACFPRGTLASRESTYRSLGKGKKGEGCFGPKEFQGILNDVMRDNCGVHNSNKTCTKFYVLSQCNIQFRSCPPKIQQV